MGCIYMIINKINNKKYIGKTDYDDVSIRWEQHKRDYKKHLNRPLYRAFNKYGLDNFIFKKICDNLYGNDLSNKEIELIKLYDTYKNGYNATLGGEGKLKYVICDFELINYYKKVKNIEKTAKYFGCCREIVSMKLKELNVDIVNLGQKLPMKSVYCKELDLQFESILEASRYVVENNISETKDIEMVRRGISRVVNGKRNTYLKMHWDKCYFKNV